MEKTIQMLQKAAQEEHAAVIQYLRHAYMMGEGEEACEIEAIARDEMRHFWMLSRWIVRLDGKPTIERGFVDTGGITLPEWMDRDVQAEDRAIAMYREYIPQIEDPALRADLERILEDELRHHGIFQELGEKFRAAQATPTGELAVGEAPSAPPAGETPAQAPAAPASFPTDLEALDWGIRHEYAAILQYLYHSFLIQDEETSRQLELQAINEMQHMGWLAEEFVSMGNEMPLEHHPVELPEAPSDMLMADIKLENETAAKYSSFLLQMADAKLKELLTFIRDHEVYHERLFKRLLERIKAVLPPRWTIGSLKKR